MPAHRPPQKPSVELPAPEQLTAAVADLPTLWSATSTSDKDRKRLLRTLLGDVTLTPDPADPTRLGVGLRWKSGAAQQLHVTRRKNATQLRATDPAALELARRIGPGLDNPALAAALNQAGHRTGTGRPFDADSAANLRHYHRIPYPGLLNDGERTPRQITEHLGVSVGTVHYWIASGFPPARRGPAGRWCIPFPPEVEARLPGPRRRLPTPAHRHRLTPPQPRRAHHRRGRRAPRCQTRRGLQLDRTPLSALSPRARRTGLDPLHRPGRGRLPAAHRELLQAPRHGQNPSRATPGKDRSMKRTSLRFATGSCRPR
jgi:hypothetical protein